MRLGKYQHFKGHFYLVLGCARNAITEEKMVLYRALSRYPDLAEEYGDQPHFVRPYTSFMEEVEHNGVQVPRFRYISTTNSESEQ